jgi:uncharacterized membrane protein YfcA
VTARDRLLAVFGGLTAGFFGGLFGVGGGLVLVPLLTGTLRFTQHEAHATSLAVIVFTALAAGTVYALHGNVSWSRGVLAGLTSALTAPLGARLAYRLSSRNLRRAFAVFMLLLALRLLWVPPHPTAEIAGVARIALVAMVGMVTGVVSGFMGIGGGTIMVPAFTLVLGFTQQLAQGTSLLAIVGAATAGSLQHRKRGTVVTAFVPWIALGSIVAGPAVSVAVQHMPHELLVRGFALFLIANGVYGLFGPGAKPR